MTLPAQSKLLSAAGLGKSFPGVQALDSVSLDLAPGEVHALVGENGAGKSTLMRIFAGLEKADCGQMQLGGQPYAPRSKAEAEALGIRMVMQELNLIANLSIAENIFLTRLPSRLGFIRAKELNTHARKIMAEVGLAELDPATKAGELGTGQQQMVEIATALCAECRVLILDEPTASLTAAETDLLFAQIERLRGQGVAIVYISHRMEEIKRIADRVTVLRDGKHVATEPASRLSIDEIIQLMVGHALGELRSGSGNQVGGAALRVANLGRGKLVREVSFEAHRGEILGFAGLMGSGRTELMRAIFGADAPDRGEIYLGGADRPARLRSPREAVRQGLAFLTEDRKSQGLMLPASIRKNLSLTTLKNLARFGVVNTSAERSLAERYIGQLSIKCASAEQEVGTLSGGNQQKVVIGKWLARDAEILIFDEPTRGIDIGAKFEIYQLLAELAARQKAVIIVSSDILELMMICDRIAVMSLGRLAGILGRGEWTQEKIMALALSEYLNGKQRSEA